MSWPVVAAPRNKWAYNGGITPFNPTQNLSTNPYLSPPTYRVNSPGINIAPQINFNINVQNIVEGMNDPFQEEQHNTDLPFFPEEILKLMHNFGYLMLKDDAQDIGFFKYTARRGLAPHLSGLHHWYVGAALMTIAQMGGLAVRMKEFMEVGSELGGEGGDLKELLDGEDEEVGQRQLPPIRVYGGPANQQQELPRYSRPQLPGPVQKRRIQIQVPGAPRI